MMDVQHWNPPEDPDADDTGGARRGSRRPAADDRSADTPRWIWLAVGAAAVAFALAGAAGGVLVADDGDEVADLRADLETNAKQIEALEDAVDDAEAQQERQANDLEQCRDTAALALDVVDAVEKLSAADSRFALTPVGSEEEAAAGEALAAAFVGVLGGAESLEEEATDCAGDAIRVDEGIEEEGATS